MIDPSIEAGARDIAARAERELDALVAISSPSGDQAGAEEALALCAALLPPEAEVKRVRSSSARSVDDLVARIPGSGRRRLLLLGHVDTVFDHPDHKPPRRDGERLYGSGAVDMKGGIILSLGVARVLARRPAEFAELSVLLVTDEEWRTEAFAHRERFGDYDACLCFEGGELDADGRDAVVVRRKAAATLRVTAAGRASHSGSAPDRGASALLALARLAIELAGLHDPGGAHRLSVVPTVVRSGGALNVVPAKGEMIVDLRADQVAAFGPVLASAGGQQDGVSLSAKMERIWPGMDSASQVVSLLDEASQRLGAPIVPTRRGGASDASHFAQGIPLTVDGLGPLGGGAHTSEEYVLAPSLRRRAEVALAIAAAALQDG